MNATQIESKVCEIIADQLGIMSEDISLDSSFGSDLGADFLDMLELIMIFEDEFDVEIGDEQARKIRKVSDVIEHVGVQSIN